MKTNSSKSQIQLEVRTIIASLEKYCAKGKQSLVLDGTAYPANDFVKKLAAYLALIEETDAQRAKWLRLVAQQRTETAWVRSFHRSLRTFLSCQFGESSEVFRAFGFKPRKAAKKKAASKARTAANRAA